MCCKNSLISLSSKIVSFFFSFTFQIVKAKVALYMESLCPGCHQFIKHQLYPVFMKYSNYIQLDLIPFGNARHTKNSDGTWEFKCQHGEPECFGNLYLACATHLLQASRPKHLIRYYNCMASASSFSIEKDVKQCAPVAGVNFRKLQTCVKSKGPEILAQFKPCQKSLMSLYNC
ncbi:gamma-interferon-inducible lysosomal thiol reductase-like [Diaphorina citri]|uniref:Gamma-interferon-inducible lysosomal thiol reductase-like n=1 Tax=Diaphorina citri TaxID=121845 RepID=A0A3Q0IQV2_DIACI|nr:gamma-interferon-inducible lysosomal thiol reductase-like [Diaphorina citri]